MTSDLPTFIQQFRKLLYLQLQGHDDSLAIILAGETYSVPQYYPLACEQVNVL
jgi:hypothetical protein